MRQVWALALAGALVAGAGAVPAAASGRGSHGAHYATPPLLVKVLGHTNNGRPKLTSSTPNGLGPVQIAGVYNLSGLSASSTAGAGQTIAIVDAYHDPNALTDLNTWNVQYGYPTFQACTSAPSSSTSCFYQADPQGTPKVNSGWVLEESLDIEWAHAEAPAANIVLVEAASNSETNLFNAVSYANSLGATEVSMSWGGSEFSGETSYDSYMTNPGTLYTASSGDSGHGTEYPAASPNVMAVGGTTLGGCTTGSSPSCGTVNETAWSGSGGGASSVEGIPGYQSGYSGPVYSTSSGAIGTLTGGQRGIPDVSFDANPSTGVSVYDSTRYQGQLGWFTLGGTSVGAPDWAGILAAGASAGSTALQGDAAVYGGGYSSNLRDITSGTNGNCGTDCTAGTGYDLVTGLGSPVNYP